MASHRQGGDVGEFSSASFEESPPEVRKFSVPADIHTFRISRGEAFGSLAVKKLKREPRLSIGHTLSCLHKTKNHIRNTNSGENTESFCNGLSISHEISRV